MTTTTTDRQPQKTATGRIRIQALSDEQLLLHYRQSGDRDVFAILVRRYERELYSFLRRYLGDPEMAEDAFQAAFLQVHLKCDSFEPGRSFRPWLYTIATNQAIDAQRRNKRHRMVSLDQKGVGNANEDVGKLLDMLVSDAPNPLAEAGAAERRQWIREAMEELPEHLSGAVRLVYYQGLKYREAAEVLGVPVGTVKSRIHTAILKLNEAWQSAHAE